HTRDTDGADAAAPGEAPLQWVFSDGLASVSLFVEPFDGERHGQEGEAVMGATHSVSRRIGEHWVTAVGEVPAATLQRFTQVLERPRGRTRPSTRPLRRPCTDVRHWPGAPFLIVVRKNRCPSRSLALF